MESALISLYGNDDSMHRFKAFKQATFDGLQERFLDCARNDDTGDAFPKKSGEAATTSLKETILISYLRSLIGETGSEGSKGSQVSHLS